ncbi:MAG: DUF937 domain-containing protein [Allosphingosinicella sp.]
MQGMEQILGSSGVDAATLGARFGLSPEQATAALGSLLPAVAGGFQKRAEAGDLDQVQAVAEGSAEPDTATGNQILGQIFGSKDVSRQVAGHAAGQSGVAPAIMKAMLPVVAAMVAQHFAKGGAGPGGASGGGLGGILGSLLGGGSGGGGFNLPGSTGGGNPLDDILGGLTRGR